VGEAVAESVVWQHVPADRSGERFRSRAVAVAEGLARLRDEAEEKLTRDPWQDRGFAARYVEHVNWLVGEPGTGAELDLYPAEAALLTLVPLVYRVHMLYGFDVPIRRPAEPTPLDLELLEGDVNLDMWQETTESEYPFGKVVVIAASLGIPPSELAARIAGLGIRLARRDLPRGLSLQMALRLVERHRTEEVGLELPDSVRLLELVTLASELRVPMKRVASWFRQLGLNAPDPKDIIRDALRQVPLARH
jgi:hypothetical protein